MAKIQIDGKRYSAYGDTRNEAVQAMAEIKSRLSAGADPHVQNEWQSWGVSL